MSKRSSQDSRHQIVVLIDTESNPFELACLIEVFGIDRPELGGPLYDVVLCARERQVVMRQGFFTMTGIAGLDAIDEADTVVVPNRPDIEKPRHPDVLDAVARAHERGARLVGTCSGAFTLAEAGVLDGRTVTAHWMWADRFRRRFPAVTLADDVLFVDDGDILTSAGSAAALDLGLHIVRRDHGAEIANLVARRLVFAAHRPGGQRQFIDRPVPRTGEGWWGPLLEWASAHATEPLTVRDLAEKAATSPATLHRRFRAELGQTPHGWLTYRRLEHARRLLENSTHDVEQVARLSGLGTAANLRTQLRRATGLSPTAYRATYAGPDSRDASHVTPSTLGSS